MTNQNSKILRIPHWRQLEAVAYQVIQDPLRRLRKNVRLVLLYGSAATKRATEYSDIDICIIVKRGRYNKHFIREGIPVNLWSSTLPEFKKIVFEPSFEWRVSIRLLSDSKVLYGDPKLLASLRKHFTKLNRKKFRNSARIMMHDMYEYLLKLKAAKAKGDRILFRHAAYELAQMSASIVSLLNMVPIGHSRNYFPPHAKIKKLPKSYKSDFQELLSTNSFSKAIRTAQHLYNGLSALF